MNDQWRGKTCVNMIKVLFLNLPNKNVCFYHESIIYNLKKKMCFKLCTGSPINHSSFECYTHTSQRWCITQMLLWFIEGPKHSLFSPIHPADNTVEWCVYLDVVETGVSWGESCDVWLSSLLLLQQFGFSDNSFSAVLPYKSKSLTALLWLTITWVQGIKYLWSINTGYK